MLTGIPSGSLEATAGFGCESAQNHPIMCAYSICTERVEYMKGLWTDGYAPESDGAKEKEKAKAERTKEKIQ